MFRSLFRPSLSPSRSPSPSPLSYLHHHHHDHHHHHTKQKTIKHNPQPSHCHDHHRHRHHHHHHQHHHHHHHHHHTKLDYNQAQSRQHPKRGTAGTKLVLQSSTIQAASNEALLVLNLYHNLRLPLLSQKSRFRPIVLGQSKISIPDGARLALGQSKISIPDGEPRIREPTCKPVRPNCPRSPKNLDSCLGNSPKDTRGD